MEAGKVHLPAISGAPQTLPFHPSAKRPEDSSDSLDSPPRVSQASFRMECSPRAKPLQDEGLKSASFSKWRVPPPKKKNLSAQKENPLPSRIARQVEAKASPQFISRAALGAAAAATHKGRGGGCPSFSEVKCRASPGKRPPNQRPERPHPSAPLHSEHCIPSVELQKCPNQLGGIAKVGWLRPP